MSRTVADDSTTPEGPMTDTGEEEVNVLESIAAITSAYQEGSAAIQELKTQRANEQASQPPRILEEVIDQAPDEIEKEKSRGISRCGKVFEKGDGTAVIALQQITIQLQSSLLKKLKDVTLDDDEATLSSLADTADLCRDSTIHALVELRQRLVEARSSQANAGKGLAQNTSQTSDGQQAQQSPERTGDTVTLRSFEENGAAEERSKPGSKETSPSRNAAAEDDVTAATQKSQSTDRRQRTGSILGFLRNVRERSNSHKDVIDEEHEVGPVLSSSPALPSHPSQDDDVSEASVKSRSQDIDLPYFTYEEGDVPSSRHRQSPDLGRRDSRIASSKSSLDAVDTPQRNSRNNSTTTLANASISSSKTVTMTRQTTSSTQGRNSMSIKHPTHENNYLGFCKGAWKLQNGDTKAMQKSKEFNDGWSQSSVYYLTCTVGKCAFGGHIAIEKIWTKVWTVEGLGLAFRWPFLAKSHVLQTKVKDRIFQFQCLFCSPLVDNPPVLSGTDAYLGHVSKEHRGRLLHDVVLWKTGCIADHVCEESEEFDINLFPLTVAEQAAMDLKMREEQIALENRSGSLGNGDVDNQDSMVTEQWHEELSDFHYDVEMEATEKEC